MSWIKTRVLNGNILKWSYREKDKNLLSCQTVSTTNSTTACPAEAEKPGMLTKQLPPNRSHQRRSNSTHKEDPFLPDENHVQTAALQEV